MTENDVPTDPLPDEAPEADLAEQRAAQVAGEDAPRWPQEVPFDADEGDAAEQSREVGLDEDDYR